MPIVDDEEHRRKRAAFIADFAKRPYYFMRGRSPRVIVDELDKILGLAR